MTIIANHASQFIKNPLLHQELKASFDSAVTTLSAVVDARHPLTAGHSERVAFYAMLIGKEMQLSGDQMETLRLAALLRDIGKIGVRDEILLKAKLFSGQDLLDNHKFFEALLTDDLGPKDLSRATDRDAVKKQVFAELIGLNGIHRYLHNAL
jgi:hypothetical protein